MIKKILNKYKSLSIMKKAIIWFTFATIIQKGITFITTPIFTRILSAEEYGTYSLYQSWLQIFSIITVLALDRCIVVGFMKFEKERKEFLATVQSLMTILVFVWTLVVFMFKNFFINSLNMSMILILTLLIVSLTTNVVANWSWLERYNYNYKRLTAFTLISVLLTQIAGILSVTMTNFNDNALVLILCITAVRMISGLFVYIDVLLKGKKYFKIEYVKFALKYSIVIIPHALSQIILTSSDKIIIDYFSGADQVAYYGIVYSASAVLTIMLTSISSSIQPWYYECIKEKKFEDIKNKTNVVLALSAVIIISSMFVAPEIISILAPANYGVAIWVFPPIAASVFFNSMYLYFANFESFYEKSSYFSIATTVGAVVNIVLNIILVPKYGFIAAGYTTLVCYIIYAYMHYLFMKKICKELLDDVKPFDIKKIIIISMLVIVSSLLITVLYHYYILRYILIAVIIVFCGIKFNCLKDKCMKIFK